MRAFISRADFARRYGIHGASELRLGSVSGSPLPPFLKVASIIDGELREARYGDSAHRHIQAREAVPGSEIMEGYSYQI